MTVVPSGASSNRIDLSALPKTPISRYCGLRGVVRFCDGSVMDEPAHVPARVLVEADIAPLIESAVLVRDGSFWESDFHVEAAELWGAIHYALGIPTVVLAAIASTSALADFDKSNVVAGVLALIVAVLSALVTFLNPQRNAELHRAAAASYKALAFSADSYGRELSLPEAEVVDALRALEEERTRLIRESPSYSRRMRRRVESRVQADMDQRARAERARAEDRST